MPAPNEQVDVCVDCVNFIANGEIPNDRPGLADDIAAQWPDAELLLDGGDSIDRGFSWTACEGCGSPLGGDRYAAVAVHRVRPRRPAN